MAAAKGIDWDALKTEYVTTSISQRDLAKKYGLNNVTISKRATADSWMEDRKKHTKRVQARCLHEAENISVTRYKKFLNSLDRLQEKIDQILELDDALPPRDLKSLSSTLTDVKILCGFKDEDEKDEDSVTVRFVDNDWDTDEEGEDDA